MCTGVAIATRRIANGDRAHRLSSRSRIAIKRRGRRCMFTLLSRFALAAGMGLLLGAAVAAESYVSRPIYSDPATGLQLPPGCRVDPSWRSPAGASDLEIWIAQCSGEARVWLLKRQVVEVVNARQSRLRFQVLDERVYPEETAGETLSVQCTGPHDESGYVVRGARWRGDGKELRLKSARGVMRVDSRTPALADTEIGAVDCVRFPEREAMMKRLQQSHD
jgi:hypothetical protein